MGVSKFVYEGSTKFDLTADTVAADKLLSGVTAHNAAGDPITGTIAIQKLLCGTAEPSSSLGDDGDIYIKVSGNGSVEAYPADYTVSKMNSSHSALGDCIGVSAQDGSSTDNVYSSGNNTTGTADYTFDLSAVPENATIDSLALEVKAHEENSSRSTCTLRVYHGSTARGSQVTVSGTSNVIYEVPCGDWTREELSSFVLRLSLGYYGGLIAGATLTVNYSYPNPSFDVNLTGTANDWSISGNDIYKKTNGTWSKVSSTELNSTVMKS